MKFIRSSSQGLYLFRQQDSIILRHFPEQLSIYLSKKNLVGKRKLVFVTRTQRVPVCMVPLRTESDLKFPPRFKWDMRQDRTDRLYRNVGTELPLYGPYNRRRVQKSYQSVMLTGTFVIVSGERLWETGFSELALVLVSGPVKTVPLFVTQI
jgi:hypothetical protein